MTSTPSASDTPAPAAAPRRRGPFAFLFKSALGCTAFALGCLVALVLLLPTMLGGTAAKIARDAFGEKFHGAITIEGAQLAWFGEQRVDGVVLYDPDKKEVARASIALPSLAHLLRSGKTDIGRVVVALDADLVQDDAGVTNLQRALEPRVKSAGTDRSSPSSASSFDLVDWLTRLDLDVELKSKRLSWSDADTRRVGLPFEVRDFLAHVTARPGSAIVVHAGGRIVAEQPGALEIDAKLDGPMSAQSAWPFGRVDATIRVENFATAMIDGIATLQGDLKEVLGERFTLKAQVAGATQTSGDIDVSLASDRANITLGARVENGALRSGDKSGFVAMFPPPRGFVKHLVESHLPPGAKVSLDANTAPWRIDAQHFVLPLPPERASDLATYLPSLDHAEFGFEFQIPSYIKFQNPMPSVDTTTPSIGAVRAKVQAVPGAPLLAQIDLRLQSGDGGNVAIEVSTRDTLSSLVVGNFPTMDGSVALNHVSTATIGGLLGQSEFLSGVLGPWSDGEISMHDLRLDSGTITIDVVNRDGPRECLRLAIGAHVADRFARFDRFDVILSDPKRWIDRQVVAFAPPGTEISFEGSSSAIQVSATDLVVPLPSMKGGDFMAQVRAQVAGTVSLHLAGAQYADATLRASGTSIGLKGIDVRAQLDAGGAATLAVRSDLEQGSARGKIAVDASTANAWKFGDGTPAVQWPPIEAHAALDGVPAALVDAFVQHDGIVGRVLGDRIGLALDAHGASANGGNVSAKLDAPRANATLSGKFEGGTFRASGEEGLVASGKIPASVLRVELAGVLPQDSALTWPNQVAEVELRASEIAFKIPDRTAGRSIDFASVLDTLAAHAQLNVAGVGFENAATRARKIDCGARDIVLDANVAPTAPLVLKLAANLTPGDAAKLSCEATLADPFAVVRGGALKPIDAKVGLAGLDPRVLDALAGQDGLFTSLLGPSVRVSIDARGASASSGAFVVDAASPAMTMHAAVHCDAAGLHCTGDEGLDAKLMLDAAGFERYVKAFVPAGARLQLAPDAGALTLKVRDVDVALPKAEPAPPAGMAVDPALARTRMLERLSKLALKLDATLPAFVYSDAATDAAQRPVTLRDVRIAADFAPSRLPSASLSAAVVDEPPGAVSASVRALDPLAQLADSKGLDTFRANVDVQASNVPTAIVDMLAGQGGVLVEALGSRVEFGVKAPEISKSKGAFEVDMHSDLHSVKGRGHVENGMLVVDEVDGLVATVGLGPVMSQRVVGKLLPTMVNVQKPAGAAPAKFSVDALRFPLDGNLRNLDGVVRIDLGEVNYALFPKLASFLGESSALSTAKIPVLTVPIQKGVAGYQKLPVKIGGREYDFSGTYDIVTDAAQLTANLPIRLLGKKVSSELDRLREYVDPELTLPLTIRGSLVNPSIGVDSKALEKVLKDAAEKVGGSLLEGLLKKKKKD